MKTHFSSRSLLAVVAALSGAFAAEAENYDKYQDWQWLPVTVADTNAIDNVRFHEDDTVPRHGPWLTLPSETGMTITWISGFRCAGGIEYREKGTEEWTALWPVKYGQIDYSRKVHAFHLTGLKPATEYEYRMLSNRDSYATAYHSHVNHGREIHSFKTLDARRDRYRFFVTSDIHGASRLLLDPMIDRSGAEDSDLFFFLGDNVEDHVGDDIEHYITIGFIDDVCRKWGKVKPTVFLRGNHDIWGIDTYKYGDYFPQPDGKTYYAFRHGPVLFVCLDTLWPAREKLQQEQHVAYLREQADWVRALRKTEAWKTAKFRVAMMHVAPFPAESDWPSSVFGDLFMDMSAEGRIHALLSGHLHVYARINPGTSDTRLNAAAGGIKPGSYPPKYFAKFMPKEPFPYVQVACHLGEAMTVDVSPEKLVFKSHRTRLLDGALYDAFELYPDGKVVDLVETTAFPISLPEAGKEKK